MTTGNGFNLLVLVISIIVLLSAYRLSALYVSGDMRTTPFANCEATF